MDRLIDTIRNVACYIYCRTVPPILTVTDERPPKSEGVFTCHACSRDCSRRQRYVSTCTCSYLYCLHVPVLRLLHRLRLVLHTEPLHWRHHWQLQHAEEEGLTASSVVSRVGWTLNNSNNIPLFPLWHLESDTLHSSLAATFIVGNIDHDVHSIQGWLR